MATNTCPNGHKYDSNIYGDNCPFCPQGNDSTSTERTRMNITGATGRPTAPADYGGDTSGRTSAGTRPMSGGNVAGGGHTVIRSVGTGETGFTGGRRLVGVLVSFSINPLGDVYKVYEGRNTMGRGATCDITVPDEKMSEKHITILYREAEGRVWMKDEMSTNGTYINGRFADDKVEINTNDVIQAGNSTFLFFRVPNKFLITPPEVVYNS